MALGLLSLLTCEFLQHRTSHREFSQAKRAITSSNPQKQLYSKLHAQAVVETGSLPLHQKGVVLAILHYEPFYVTQPPRLGTSRLSSASKRVTK